MGKPAKIKKKGNNKSRGNPRDNSLRLRFVELILNRLTTCEASAGDPLEKKKEKRKKSGEKKEGRDEWQLKKWH